MDRKLNKISIIISYLSIFISIIGTFFVTPVILKNIGDSNYGLYSFCTSITSWFAILTTAIGSSYIYFANKDIKENNNCSRTNTMFIRVFILVSSIVFSLLVLLVPLLYFSNITLLNYSLEDSKVIFLLFGISGVQVVVSILFNFFHLFLISKEKFFFVRLKNMLVEVALYILLLFSALVFKSIFAVAISSLVTTTISGVLNIAMVIKLKNLSFYKPQKGEFKGKYNEILTYIFFVFINTLITTMNNNLDKTILGAMVGPVFVTLYQLSFSFSLYLTLMSGFISETYMPRIHGFYKDGLNGEAEKLFLLLSKIQTILLVFIVGGFIAVGNEFVLVWVGQERISIYLYASALLLLTIVPSTTLAAIDCERANNKQKFRAIVMLSFAVINVAISIVLIKISGASFAIWSCIIGTAVSKIISEWIILPIYDHLVLHLPIKSYYLYLVKIVIYASSGVGLAFLSRHFLLGHLNAIPLLLVEGIIFVVVYLSFIIVFDRKIVISFIRGKLNENIIKEN